MIKIILQYLQRFVRFARNKFIKFENKLESKIINLEITKYQELQELGKTETLKNPTFQILKYSYNSIWKIHEVYLLNQVDLRGLKFINTLWNTLQTVEAWTKVETKIMLLSAINPIDNHIFYVHKNIAITKDTTAKDYADQVLSILENLWESNSIDDPDNYRFLKVEFVEIKTVKNYKYYESFVRNKRSYSTKCGSNNEQININLSNEDLLKMQAEEDKKNGVNKNKNINKKNESQFIENQSYDKKDNIRKYSTAAHSQDAYIDVDNHTPFSQVKSAQLFQKIKTKGIQNITLKDILFFEFEIEESSLSLEPTLKWTINYKSLELKISLKFKYFSEKFLLIRYNIQYYIYTNNNLNLNNKNKPKKLLKDVIYEDSYLYFNIVDSLQPANLSNKDKIIDVLNNIVNNTEVTIIRGIYDKWFNKKGKSNYRLKNIVMLKQIKDNMGFDFINLPSQINQVLTPIVQTIHNNNLVDLDLFFNLISKYVEILQKYKTKANANKIIEITPVKDLVEKGSKSKTNLNPTREHLTKYLHGNSDLYIYSLIIIEFKYNLGSIIVCFDHINLKIEYAQQITSEDPDLRFQIIKNNIIKIVQFLNDNFSKNELINDLFGNYLKDPAFKFKFLVPHYKSKDKNKSDKNNKDYFYNEDFINNLSLNNRVEIVPFDWKLLRKEKKKFPIVITKIIQNYTKISKDLLELRANSNLNSLEEYSYEYDILEKNMKNNFQKLFDLRSNKFNKFLNKKLKIAKKKETKNESIKR